MFMVFRKMALVPLMGAALALSACASNSDVEKAQQTADQAMTTAQQAQQTANEALTTAKDADQKADAALSKANQPPMHRGPRG